MKSSKNWSEKTKIEDTYLSLLRVRSVSINSPQGLFVKQGVLSTIVLRTFWKREYLLISLKMLEASKSTYLLSMEWIELKISKLTTLLFNVGKIKLSKTTLEIQRMMISAHLGSKRWFWKTKNWINGIAIKGVWRVTLL